MAGELLPVVLSLTAAFFFAAGIQALNQGLRYADSRVGTLIDIATATVFFWLLSPLYLKTEYWLSSAALIFAAVGLFRPAISANLALAGVRRLGPTLASTLGATTPLFGALFGVALLGEQLTAPLIIGTLAVVAGTMLETRPGKEDRDWPLWALALPLGASCLRSGAHVLIRIGLAFAPSPLFAGLVAYSVSLVVAFLAETRRSDSRRVQWRSPGLLWYVLAGVMHATAVWTMNAALQRAPVSVVLPLISSSPVFTLLISALVLRREVIDRRKIAMVVLVVAGVAYIAATR